ncbi:MAG TPA: type VI secretion system tube protein TssD [Ignavibacteriaceae bacterium]|nr:type VI secretion system tube protein TssD [Ignavibacteriaceae bacterium]
MAVKGEVIFKDHEGNVLKGPHENGSSFIWQFNHEVFLPSGSEDHTIQGYRKIMAFEIVKVIDELTPQLYQIMCKGDTCTEVAITLFRISPETGGEEAYFKFLLKNAKIISVSNWMYPVFDPVYESYGHMEKIKILAKEFTWEFIKGGVSYTEETF